MDKKRQNLQTKRKSTAVKTRFTNETQTREDRLFKYFVHLPRILAMILKTCIKELADMEIDEIVRYLTVDETGVMSKAERPST